MAKLSGGKPQIDEDFMKEIISQGLPVKKQETPMVAIPTEVKLKRKHPTSRQTYLNKNQNGKRKRQRMKRR